MKIKEVSKALAGALVGALAPHLGMVSGGEVAMGLTEILATVIGAVLGYVVVYFAPKNQEPSA